MEREVAGGLEALVPPFLQAAAHRGRRRGRDRGIQGEDVGRVVAQDEETSAVYGMPRAARPHADAVLPLGEIGAEIVRFARGSG